MKDDLARLREILGKIAELASEAAGFDDPGDGNGADELDLKTRPSKGRILCTPKYLPKSMQLKAARHAVSINAFNQPEFGPMQQAMPDLEITPAFIAVMTSKYWGRRPRTLSVSFMESTPSDLRRRILSHLNAWSRAGCIRFAWTGGTGDVRISRGSGGYYSYLGTDILLIPRDRQTMNLQGFTMRTPDSEFLRVVRHEAGHTLGFPHEHMRRALVARIDPEKAYAYFGGAPNFWSRSMVDQQVLTPLDERSLMGTPADQTSIMCYQLPGSITRDGRPILGGTDINESDYDFVAEVYPKPGHFLAAEQEEDQEVDQWEPEEIEGAV